MRNCFWIYIKWTLSNKEIIIQSPLTYEGERLYIIPNNPYLKPNIWKDHGYKLGNRDNKIINNYFNNYDVPDCEGNN